MWGGGVVPPPALPGGVGGMLGIGGLLGGTPLAPPGGFSGVIGGGGFPVGGRLLPPVPLMGPPPAASGPWLMGAIHRNEVFEMTQSLPCFLEIVLPTTVTGGLDCTGVVHVVQAYAPSGHGCFLESMFLGASDVAVAAGLAHLWGQVPPPVLHVCFGDLLHFIGAGDWPGRPTIHVNTIRVRAARSLTEAWLPGLAALVGALGATDVAPPTLRGAGSPLFAGVVAGTTPDGTTTAPAADTAGTAVEDARVSEMKEKLAKLKKKLAKGDIGRSLVTRARDRGRSRSRSRSESSSTGRGRSGTSKKGGGVQKTADDQPGALFLAGLQNMAKYLASRTGSGGSSGDTDSTLSVSAVTWLLTIYYATNPPASLGVRNAREMRTVCECIDALLDGRLAHLGDLLMQRLKALQTAHAEGNWDTARFLELIPPGEVVLPSEEERRSAMRDRSMDLRLSRHGAKGSSGGRSASPF